ncbi:3-hydroxyacyl-CoA dehydrogenase family protein [Chloroflexota bacterium]
MHNEQRAEPHLEDPRYAAPPFLQLMALAGHLGRKGGRGFYTYE